MIQMGEVEMRRRYGGRYVAGRDGEVIASADTYEQLSKQLERMAVEWTGLIIEYVEPVDVVRVY